MIHFNFSLNGPEDIVERARSTGVTADLDGSLRLERAVEWDNTTGIPDTMLNPRVDEPAGFRLPWGRRSR